MTIPAAAPASGSFPSITRKETAIIVCRGAGIDFDAACSLCDKFIENINTEKKLGLTQGGIYPFLAAAVASEDGLIALSPDRRGMVIGVVAPYPLDCGKRIAAEIAWYCESPKWSVPLLKFYEAWAESRGADFIQASMVPGISPESIGRVYAKRGYVKTDEAYLRVRKWQ